MTRTRKPLVREVNPHLICVLCSGYLIEATTIVECLHSFCRSCLIKYLENNKFCPICDVQLHKNNPLLSVRMDQLLQQLVYKLVPGLYAKEMSRRRQYYSELTGPSSDPDNAEYPIPDVYFSPTDSISLSLEFVCSGHKGDACGTDGEESVEMQGVHHRRYLQCPAAVNISHLKKFLRMKYDLNADFDVEILHAGEVLTDEFSLMDVAYTFSWNKTTPMRFQFRLLQKQRIPNFDAQKYCSTRNVREKKISELLPEETNMLKLAEEAEANLGKEESKNRSTEKDTKNKKIGEESLKKQTHEREGPKIRLTKKDDSKQAMETSHVLENEKEEQRLEEEEAIERLEEEDTIERMEEAMIEEVEEITPDPEPVVVEVEKPKKEESVKIPERTNGLKRPANIEIPTIDLDPPKKPKQSLKMDSSQYKQDEKRFLEDMIEEDTDDDRLRISASEEEKSPEPRTEVEKPRSEERRRKKNKKGKHHHHHRHHDRKRCDSPQPPTAQIVHSPENDLMKLKVKLVKSSDNVVKGYTLSDSKDYKENGWKTATDNVKPQKEEEMKKAEPVVLNNNNNTINTNKNNSANVNSNSNSSSNHSNSVNHHITTNQLNSNVIAEFTRRAEELNKEKTVQQVKTKTNGLVPKVEPLKLPPSSITVSKITAAEKRQMEQQKLFLGRHGATNGLESKRPSLEIMLVNAPKKTAPEAAAEPPKAAEATTPPRKVMRPTPPSIPLCRLPKSRVPGKGSPPPLRPVRPADEALDLSGKSTRRSPELSPSEVPHARLPPPGPQPGKTPYIAAPARPCKPNPTVRQIPNPSALLFRQNLNSMKQAAAGLPPPALPISSLRQMETMTKKIEKVAAGLTVKAAATAAYAISK